MTSVAAGIPIGLQVACGKISGDDLRMLLESGAELEHYRLQDESCRAYHISSLQVRQADHSRYAATCVSLGAAWSRTECRVEFTGAGASAELSGLYLVGERRFSAPEGIWKSRSTIAIVSRNPD